MNIRRLPLRCCSAVLLAALLFSTGCFSTDSAPSVPAPTRAKTNFRNITLETQGERRRVLIDATVSERQGALEILLAHKGPNSKAYEAIVAADVDARQLNEALLLAKAIPGAPLRYEPEFLPARGQPIKVSFRYEKDGKQATVPAESWIRTHEGKPVELTWVFTGSRYYVDEVNGVKRFLAQEEGTLIGLGTSEAALLDVNVRTGQVRSDLDFDYWTERIPEKGTKVIVILEPFGDYKKGQ